jgi:5'-methylthioadenosine phosphorylase
VKVGIIGGSGVYNPSMFHNIRAVQVNTPFGMPSDPLLIGDHNGTEVVFLSRHGTGHRFSPSKVNYRANILALKMLGVTHIISVSAVGSLREDYKPLDIVIPDQVYDRTRCRDSTFFEDGIVAHIGFADPFCPELSKVLYDIAKEHYPAHGKGTYICMEGPQFSTKAESNVYRKMGFDIIGMTALPEAKLAREAEICYAVIACVTDYDCWRRGHDAVTAEMIIGRLRQNIDTARKIIRLAVGRVPKKRDCDCGTALSTALVTAPDVMPEAQKQKLDLLIGKYLRKG